MIMLFKPSPIFATENGRNCPPAYTVLFTQLALKYATLCVALAYFYDLFLGKLGVAVCFPVRMTTLSNHIGNVVIVCSKKEMRWITTRAICPVANRIVYVAFMKNVEATNNHAIRENPRDAVSEMLIKESGISVKAISFWALWPLPQPAIIWATLLNVCPKIVLCKYSFWASVMSLDKVHGLSAQITRASIGVFVYLCLLAATTVAVSPLNYKRWIMGRGCEQWQLWGNIHFVVSPFSTFDLIRRRVSSTLAGISIAFYSCILPHLNEWSNPATRIQTVRDGAGL